MFPQIHRYENAFQLQLCLHHSLVCEAFAVAVSASMTGANSRRGSNCSSIYQNSTNQNTYLPVPVAQRNSKGVDQSVTRSNSQTTSSSVTDNNHPNSRNSQQKTTTTNHTSTASPDVEDTNTDPSTVCMPVICR